MNAPYSFNFKYDPILENPFRSEIDYNREIDERVRQLQLMKDKIIAESNRELETFKKFQIAAQANPNLTYKEFCENINNK